MAIQQPVSTDKLTSPDHSLSHRVFANDDAAPVQTVVVDSAGNTKIGNADSTDYTEIEADGTLVFHGAATVWEDLRIVPSTFDFGGSGDPSVGNYQPGGSGAVFKVYEFQLGDEGFFTVQLPHSYDTEEDIKVHVHWTPRDRGNEESGNAVAWKIDYSWANIGGTFGPSATADCTDACNGVDHEHNMSPDVTISGSGKGISSMLLCRIYREDVAGDTWVGTSAAQSPVLLEVDFHFPMDTVGSRQSGSK